MTTKNNNNLQHSNRLDNSVLANSIQAQQNLINRQNYISALHQHNCMGLDVMMRKNHFNNIQNTHSNIS